MKIIRKAYRLAFYYVPYVIYKKEGVGNEVAVFIRCVLLFLANIVSILVVWLLLSGTNISFPENLTRGGAKFLGLLFLVPFAVLFFVQKNRYKRVFSDFEMLGPGEKNEMDRYARKYIYGSIILLVVVILAASFVVFSPG